MSEEKKKGFLKRLFGGSGKSCGCGMELIENDKACDTEEKAEDKNKSKIKKSNCCG